MLKVIKSVANNHTNSIIDHQNKGKMTHRQT